MTFNPVRSANRHSRARALLGLLQDAVEPARFARKLSPEAETQSPATDTAMSEQTPDIIIVPRKPTGGRKPYVPVSEEQKRINNVRGQLRHPKGGYAVLTGSDSDRAIADRLHNESGGQIRFRVVHDKDGNRQAIYLATSHEKALELAQAHIDDQKKLMELWKQASRNFVASGVDTSTASMNDAWNHESNRKLKAQAYALRKQMRERAGYNQARENPVGQVLLGTGGIRFQRNDHVVRMDEESRHEAHEEQGTFQTPVHRTWMSPTGEIRKTSIHRRELFSELRDAIHPPIPFLHTVVVLSALGGGKKDNISKAIGSQPDVIEQILKYAARDGIIQESKSPSLGTRDFAPGQNIHHAFGHISERALAYAAKAPNALDGGAIAYQHLMKKHGGLLAGRAKQYVAALIARMRKASTATEKQPNRDTFSQTNRFAANELADPTDEQPGGRSGRNRNSSGLAPSPECPECGSERGHPVDRQDGTDACTHCSGRCSNCAGWVDRDELQPTLVTTQNRRQNQVPVCQECREDSGDFFHCADCDKNFSAHFEGGLNDHRETVCQGCANHYTGCDNCGRLVHQDDIGSDGLCAHCQSPESARSGHTFGKLKDLHEVELSPDKPEELPHWLSEPDSVKMFVADAPHKNVVNRFFNAAVSKGHFAQMAGLANGHHALISIGHKDGRPVLHVEAINPAFDSPDKTDEHIKHSVVCVSFTRDADGRIHVTNDLVVLGKHAGPLIGHGREIYHGQIMALRKAGVHMIHSSLAMSAEKKYWSPTVPNPDPENPNHWTQTGYVGGRVWPLFGFGGKLGRGTMKKIPESLRSQMKGNDVRDLLDVPGGADWWKRNAQWVEDGYMELDQNSRTGKAHDAAWDEVAPRLQRLEQRRRR